MTAIRIIGVPMDLGASRRGVDMGPYAVRYTDLRQRLEHLGHSVDDVGNVAVLFREDAERGRSAGALPRRDHGRLPRRRAADA